MATRPLVIVVDDDESIRESLPDLLREFGFAASGFASAEELLSSPDLERAQALVLDVSMPGMTGPELRQELVRRGRAIPVVFITAHADEQVRRELVAAGAIDVLFKPFTEQALFAAVTAAAKR